MAEIGRFFDGPAYGAQAHAEFYTNFLSTGFFMGLDVTANNTLQVTIASGAAFLEGHEYRNTESLNLEHNIADSANDRIDRVVIRLDNTPEAERPLRAMIRSGMPNSNPEPPELVRNDAIHEISLAQVLIEAGKSFIEQYQITDERGDINVCGRVGMSNRIMQQVDSVDAKGPDVPASQYRAGESNFYLGSNNLEVMQEWFDSLPVSPETYGRNLDQLRIYVESTSRRNNTGIQKVTIFDWSNSYDYQVYGIFIRAANVLLTAERWGRWQEKVFVYDEGENSNGKYVRYSNGWQKCYSPYIFGTPDESTGNVYRSPAINWSFPANFVTDDDNPIYLTTSSTNPNRWSDLSGYPSGTDVFLRLFSSVQAQSDSTIWAVAEGRWR